MKTNLSKKQIETMIKKITNSSAYGKFKKKPKTKAKKNSALKISKKRGQIAITEVKKNPAPQYVIRGKFFFKDAPYYFNDHRWINSKSSAQKFPTVKNAIHYMKARRGKWSYEFPSLHTVGVIKA